MKSKGFFGKVASGVLRALKVVVLIVATCALVLVFFMLLPIIQEASTTPEADVDVRSVSAVNLPPPPPPPEEEIKEEEKEEEPPPEMQEPDVQPLDLSQLELALNPGFGGDGDGAGGDFKLSLDSLSDAASEAAEAVFSMEDLDQAPKATVQVPPEYPKELGRKKLRGTVKIVFIVDKSGRVVNPIVQSSSHPAFANPALRAVRRWRFEPGKRGGAPVQFKMRVPIVFASK